MGFSETGAISTLWKIVLSLLKVVKGKEPIYNASTILAGENKFI
jgi:hypothetical protein